MLPLLTASEVSVPFLLAWNFDPVVGIGLALGVVLYTLALRRARAAGRRTPPAWQVGAYYAGLFTVALALLGPLDAFNTASFAIHMLQHLALIQIAAPLILLGRPVQVLLRGVSPRRAGPVVRAVLGRRPVRAVLTVLTHPVAGFLLLNGAMVLWHLPRFYDAALRNDTIHELEHLMFFGFALIFWWAIIEPVPRHHKLPLPWALTTIFFSGVVATAIGAILTLASTVIYPFYLHVTNPWGLSPMADQQIAGLTMWVGGGFLYGGILLGMVVAVLNRQFADDEDVPAGALPGDAQHLSRPA
ncbi:MAG TPA: cytochrome c oxidase assembly protein [Thermomicrobiaceae bacterium]|nr:cytochrome c oxidase assembly protein [Thermomicrobiaceae bacterium]